MLGDAVGINAIISVAASLMVLLSNSTIQIINLMVPWFVVAFLFFILLLLIFMLFGAKETDIFNYIKNDRGVAWVIIGVALIIFIAAFGKVLGQNIGPYLDEGQTEITGDTANVATGDFETNVTGIMFHPKVLGLMIIFGVIIFSIGLLTGTHMG